MATKLNWLLQNSAPGDVILQSRLSQHAISPSLAFKYAQSGWLKRGNGVYARAGREPEWNDALACLQNQLAAPVYVAGLSSLVWQGRSHYLQLKQNQCWLSVENKSAAAEMVQGIPGCGVDSHIGEKLPVLDDRYRVTLDIKGKNSSAVRQNWLLTSC